MKCEVCGSTKDVALENIRPIIRAARREHALCAQCKDKVNQGNPDIILTLGGIIGQELSRKVFQPRTK
jgi:hypothetical protein